MGKKEANSRVGVLVYYSLIAGAILLTISAVRTIAQTSSSSSTVNLTIADATDSENRFSNLNFSFFANFTNTTGIALNASYETGLCQIQFNFSGTYSALTNMTFNQSSLRWDYNRSFNTKGTHQFNVSCTSLIGNISTNETFVIRNTAPSIFSDFGGDYINFDGNNLNDDYWSCTEDTACYYNFTKNITEPDTNDVLTYLNSTTNTTLNNFTLNNASGMLEINVTNSFNNGTRQVRLIVRDNENAEDTAILRVNITGVNDLPVLQGLNNRSFNATELFEYLFNVTDEENNTQYNISFTFVSCIVASWSNRGSNCVLFNTSQYTANGTTTGVVNISFTPTRNDVGNYTINVSARDSGTPNATASMLINFTVINLNLAPYFRYTCDNERNATEDTPFSCYINVSDLDETNNITLIANYTFFTFNMSSPTNRTQVPVNVTLQFNGTALVNFTPRDVDVGNWSVNITLEDTTTPLRKNSTTFYFFVYNINDSVTLDTISNLTAFTTNNYTILINATDDDLLITGKHIYNESINISSNTSWVNVSRFEHIAEKNKTTFAIDVYTNYAPGGSGTNHTINISVNDANNFSRDSKLFIISIRGNTVPEWNSSTGTNHTINEDTSFYLNLTKNVTDPNGDTINFTWRNDTAFASFSVNLTTGIINFTPRDADVGHHIVVINATDGVTPVPLTFNFSIRNVNDNPAIITPITIQNATRDTSSNVNATEDNVTTISIFVEDDDLRILVAQRGYYNESLTMNRTIVTAQNPSLFSFGSAVFISNNRSRFSTTFTPNKSDVGTYNVTFNVTDANNVSSLIYINLTILKTEHIPELNETGNLNTSIEEIFYVDFNVTDDEEGNETSPGANFTFQITNLTANGNFLTINATRGIVNFTMNRTFAGSWQFNISVNDTTGRVDYHLFNLSVYDFPVILVPATTAVINLAENVTVQLNFSVNHTVGDNVNYSIYISNGLRNSTRGNGNGTMFLWNFTANFTEETTCTGTVNITLNISNAKLSNTTTWNLTVNHTNYPLGYSGLIGGNSRTITSSSGVATVTLSDFFTDTDASDPCQNQTIGFNHTQINAAGGAITITIVNWTNTTTPLINFSVTSEAHANFTVLGLELNRSNISQVFRSNVSNNFTVHITVPVSTSTPTSGGGGGGGGGASVTVNRLISLKLIIPDPVTAKKKDHLILPVTLENDGNVDLNDILLESLIAKNGLLRSDLIASFDRSSIQSLPAGTRENVVLIIDIDTKEAGRYEVTINGTVRNPPYRDWGKLYIDIKEDEDVEERIIFTEEFVIGNPECTELKELIDEAREILDKGDRGGALRKVNEVLDACKRAIAQPPRARALKRIEENLFGYISFASILAFGIGIGYYYYQKRKLRRALEGYT